MTTRNRLFYISLILCLIGLALLFCIKCGWDSMDDFKAGRNTAWSKYAQSFDYLPDTPKYEIINYRGLRLHLCTPAQYPNEQMRKEKRYGYIIGDDIYLWTKFYKGQYIINEFALGHEVLHDIDFKNDLISDPDTWG